MRPKTIGYFTILFFAGFLLFIEFRGSLALVSALVFLTAFFIFPIIAAASYVIAFRRKKVRKLPTPVPTLLVFGLGVLFGFVIDQELQKRAKTRGDQIILALEKYSEAHGNFPKSLEELSPQHIAVIPNPGNSILSTTHWNYSTFKENFVLSFDVPLTESNEFTYGQGIWDPLD